MMDAVSDLVDRIGGGGEILFLHSVNSTGRISRYFQSVAPRGSKARVLFDTSAEEDVAPQALVRLPIERYPVSQHGQCALCSEEGTLTGINPETFERELFRRPQFLRATHDRLEMNKDFWQLVDQMDACKLHHDDAQLRHHPIFFEVDRLLAHPAFRRRALDTLTRIGTPRLVLIPRHRGSDVVEDLVREAFPATHIEILPVGTREIPEHMGPRIASSGHILIADDAIITTQTITSLKLQVYRLCKRYGQSPKLDAFAVIARPTGREELKELKNRLYDSLGAHLHYVQLILLPHPSPDYCPFCQERSLLQRLLNNLSPEIVEIVQDRVRNLRGTVYAPLITSGDSERIQGSYAGENLRKRTIFAATQAVAQEMVDEALRKESANETWRIDTNDLIGKYFDAEILGAFLRSFNRSFLWWPGHVEKVARQLEDYPSNHSSVAVVAEIGWAAALGRLPAEATLRLLERHPNVPVMQLMRELIELNVLGRSPKMLPKEDPPAAVREG